MTPAFHPIKISKPSPVNSEEFTSTITPALNLFSWETYRSYHFGKMILMEKERRIRRKEIGYFFSIKRISTNNIKLFVDIIFIEKPDN